MPDGMSWNLNSPCSVMTVWPALLPPWERITMSAFAARKSMTFPFPSSPHWPPTRMMTKGLLGTWFGPARLQVVEPRVIAPELEIDHPGWAVAVLGDVQFGDARPFVGFVVLRPKQKHDHVTILFNRPRLTKVAQDRALVRAAAQLRDGDHRNAQLASQSLESARNRRDLLDPVVVASGATVHQLQVVDEDHVDVVAHLGLTSLELQTQLVHYRSVINENGRLAKGAKRVRHAVELSLGQQAAMHSLSIDLRLFGQQPFGELLLRHLETEDGDRLLGLQCRVQRNVECKARFSHRGPARDGKNEPCTQHCVALCIGGQEVDRHLQSRDVEGAAHRTVADRTGADRCSANASRPADRG